MYRWNLFNQLNYLGPIHKPCLPNRIHKSIVKFFVRSHITDPCKLEHISVHFSQGRNFPTYQCFLTFPWLVQQKHHDRVPRSRTLNVTSLSSSHIVPTLKMEGWKLKIIISKQTIPLPPAFQPTSSFLACLGVSWPQLLLRVLTKHVSYLIAFKTIAEHTPWNEAKLS